MASVPPSGFLVLDANPIVSLLSFLIASGSEQDVGRLYACGAKDRLKKAGTCHGSVLSFSQSTKGWTQGMLEKP